MRMLAFAGRNGKELLRDPLTNIFGVGFPLVLISLIAFMKASIKDMPAELFAMETFAPGMAIFGFSFFTIFLGTLVSNDRVHSFLMRLFASPLKSADYILGYTLPALPLAAAQGIICLLFSCIFGLPFTWQLLPTLLVLLPVAILFFGLGILNGAVFSGGQIGGIGSIIVQICAWLSGIWFDLDMVGGAFRTVCYLLPFAHAVDAVKLTLSGNYAEMWPHLAWVSGYAIVFFVLAIFVFHRKVRNS